MSKPNTAEQPLFTSFESSQISPTSIESPTQIVTPDISKGSRSIRNTLIGLGSFGLIAFNIVPEIKLSNSGLSANFDSAANAAVTIDGKKIIVSVDDIKNGLVFTDSDYKKHEPNKDFLNKYKNISDEGINAVLINLVSEQKVQQISNLMIPTVKPEDQLKVAELTQEIVTQLNSPKKTFNIDSKELGTRPAIVKEATSTPATPSKVINTSPKDSFIKKPTVSSTPEASPSPATATEPEKPQGMIAVEKPKDDPLSRTALLALAGVLGLTAVGLTGLGIKRAIEENDAKEYETPGYDWENNTRYPKPSLLTRLKYKLLNIEFPDGPTREDFADLDDDEFIERITNLGLEQKRVSFGSDADKRFKLNHIFTKLDLTLSIDVQTFIYELIMTEDIKMYSKPRDLATLMRKELNYTSHNVSSDDLLIISEILLDKNF